MSSVFHLRSLQRVKVLAGILLLVTASLAGASDAAVQTEAYTWKNVAIGGGGFVTGIIAHPTEKGLRYARTDVGGAYRWDAAARRWIPLTDWISEADGNLMGIESLAVDPRDPRWLYVAAGTYGRFPAAILRSDDQGRTFQRTDVPIAMGGNELGRFAGERLAVDPNQGSILFFGSRRDGLWRSADHGASWRRVDTFTDVGDAIPLPPAIASRMPPGWANQHVGIVSVVFDAASGRPGEPTPVVYAAVSSLDDSVFRSDDAGVTWAPIVGQPHGLRPNHLVLSSARALYLSYTREPGPAQISDGAVWKYTPPAPGAAEPAGSGWRDITPEKPGVEQPFGYGCVALDAAHPGTLLVSTFTHWKPHDQLFRSTDDGATWRPVWTEATQWDHSSAPYTATRKPHWLGTVWVNPHDSNEVLFTTGYGIWASHDISAVDAGRPTHWEFLNEGLEETVPLALISPPVGPHLVSGVGDVDGFRHDDVDASPAAGSFAGPRFSSTRDLVFASQRPELLARIGNAGRGVVVHGALSSDGGRTWQPLAQDAPGGENGFGLLALSADGRRLLWVNSEGAAYVTSDRGAKWVRADGISELTAVAADPADPARFYAYAARSGRVLVSTDGGLHFAPTPAVLPEAPHERATVLGVTAGWEGAVWVGTKTIGLHGSTDGGRTFARVPAVTAVDALGFGCAAPGRDRPAMFLRGSVAGRPGIYRSDDAGTTWIRINDDAHQFGSANRPLIVGDPRIYGRVYLSTGGRGIIYGDRRD